MGDCEALTTIMLCMQVYEALNEIGVAVTTLEVDKMVKAADKDGEGGIDEDELRIMIQDVAEGKATMRAAFKQVSRFF